MGVQKHFELLDDFIKEVKNRNIKVVFFTAGNVAQEGVTQSIITLTAMAEDSKTFYSHKAVTGTIAATEETKEEDIQAYLAANKAKLDETVETLQKDHSQAVLIAGYCAPTDG